ncbi:MAG: ComF family protein [Paraglaciecola sp.]|uniref:ComF family protein n=1 Tax=Paraglaciecola sp. TaxID=1920173 RepID=UPI00273F2D32|nr:ComF family protein [Paraglaciecola sp.]MDP5029860.1 ComF family protein [Paraglaciecola sp.]MDP5130980.1 ComF family protein [Paraglaciecola sp.]
MQSLIMQDCLICRQLSKRLICTYCQQDLVTLQPPGTDKNLMLLPNVAKGLAQVEFKTLYAVCDYQWPISKLLTALKFGAKLPNARALAELFVKHNVNTHFVLPKAILPIPLHKNRFLWRKYNQSVEICRHISQLTSVPSLHSALTRKNATLAQTKLSAAQRKVNLRQAFQISSSGFSQLANIDHIALFDDVTTTGATANAAYRCLKNTFPQLKIDIWSICVTLVH